MVSEQIHSRASIGYVAEDNESLAPLAAQFSASGFSLAPLAKETRADLVLVDVRRMQSASPSTDKTVAQIRALAAEAPILFLTDDDASDQIRANLRRYGDPIAVKDDAQAAIARAGQILRLRNIAEESGERLKTLAQLNRLVEFPPLTATKEKLKMLVAGAAGPSAMAAMAVGREEGANCVCAFSAAQTMRALDREDFDCAVFITDGAINPLFSLGRALRRHPRHAPMSIFYVAEGSDEAALIARKDARETILRHHISADLPARMRTAMRRTRLLRAMQRFLTACNGEGVRDPKSGAFTSSFLSEHGARLCARADQTGCPLSLSLISLDETEAEPQFGRRALSQAARLLNRVTRCEDIVSRIGVNSFAVLHPATIEADANIIARRLSGVIANTAFTADANGGHFALSVAAHVSERKAGASIEETIAGLLRDHPTAKRVKPLRPQFLQ